MTETLSSNSFDVLVIGAGFGGLAALHRFRDQLGYSVRALEAASGPGGTWWWNRYPGARCDVESLQYCLAFSEAVEQEWTWTERFAEQGEILAYAEFVVNRCNLAKDIQFNTRVTAAAFDEEAGRWTITTEQGEQFDARWLVLAAGPLSSTYIPPFPGKETFKGEVYHTGVWPHHEVSFKGKRVAVIGTGSSGVQLTTHIAKDVAHLYVMQRTAHHSVPAANRPLHPGEHEAVKARYKPLREEWNSLLGATAWRSLPVGESIVHGDRSIFEFSAEEQRATFERAWNYGGTTIFRSFNDILRNDEANDIVTEYCADKVRQIVQDPKVAELLISKQRFGTKRLILDSGYFEMFNRPNVTLVDVRSDPIERLTPTGIKTKNASYDVDMVVFATGFDAMTGSLTRIDIRGRGGRSLRDDWRDGPHSYLGIMVAGFPNMFVVGGPQSPSALANVIVANEQQVDWIGEAIRTMDKKRVKTIEARPEAQAAWVDLVNELGAASIYAKGDNWYLGANIPGKPRMLLIYTGGFPAYRSKCEEVAQNDYEGFVLKVA
jgi:cation diffusion facilitator CzcD-associated flavoprotein CzcO